jgi:hypothetical protein
MTTAKKAHFTVEFIPTHSNGMWKKCNQEEVFIIQHVISDILAADTGFADPDVQLYLDRHYKLGKHPGFDFSYECPASCESQTEYPFKEWCEVLCEQSHSRLGHKLLENLGRDVKRQIHSKSKAVEGLFDVKCLGTASALDLHLAVSVSPYIEEGRYKEL